MRYVTALIVVILAFPATASAAEIYVSKTTGGNSNPGTKEAPKKLLWKVLNDLSEGDVIRVAEGTYNGRKKLGVMPKLTQSNVTIEGGWNADFSARDPFKHLTVITASGDRQGDTAWVFHCEGPTDITIDGFMIDRGASMYYASDGEPGANKRIEGHVDSSSWGYRAMNKKKSGSSPAIQLLGKGSFTVRNNIMVNNPWWGIYIKGGGEGQIVIENNFILSYQGRGIEAIPGGGWGKPQWVIRNNTIAFGHTTEGRALSIDPRKGTGNYLVENNVIAFGTQSGVMTKFGAKGDSLTLNNNLFFYFLQADAGDGGSAVCNVDEFEDELECNMDDNNLHEVPKFIAKMSKKWFHRWSQNAGANDLMAKDEELMAARNTLGLEAFELAGYEKTFGSYKELPDGRPGYALSRYPFPLMKANDGMDWQEWILPMIGADGERGIKAFSAN